MELEILVDFRFENDVSTYHSGYSVKDLFCGGNIRGSDER